VVLRTGTGIISSLFGGKPSWTIGVMGAGPSSAGRRAGREAGGKGRTASADTMAEAASAGQRSKPRAAGTRSRWHSRAWSSLSAVSRRGNYRIVAASTRRTCDD
jgi:hypothetical protein